MWMGVSAQKCNRVHEYYSSLHFIVVSKLLASIVRDTGNNLLVM